MSFARDDLPEVAGFDTISKVKLSASLFSWYTTSQQYTHRILKVCARESNTNLVVAKGRNRESDGMAISKSQSRKFKVGPLSPASQSISTPSRGGKVALGRPNVRSEKVLVPLACPRRRSNHDRHYDQAEWLQYLHGDPASPPPRFWYVNRPFTSSPELMLKVFG